MRNFATILGLSVFFLVLTGCDAMQEKEEVDLSEGGYQYKGVVDPLLSTSGADRAGALGDRFDLVQGRQ